MSEFPEWVEQRGLVPANAHEAQELHRRLAVVYQLIPDIDDRMAMTMRWPYVPYRREWSWWKRYLWYVSHA